LVQKVGKREKEYLIDMEKIKGIYCGVFFIRNQKVVLFLKYMENGWETAKSALSGLTLI